MGAIQDKVNSLTGSIGILGAGLSHGISQGKAAEVEKAKVEAEVASTEEQLKATKAAYKNDTIEAAKAIGAHEADFGELDFNGKKIKDITNEEYAALDDAKVEELADVVDKFREGKLKQDRIDRLEEASNLPETGRHTVKRARTIPGQRVWRQSINVKTGKVEDLYRDIPAKHIPGKYISNKDYKNQQLEKSYEAFRELNNRIAASRELKFDIKAATEKINRLQQGGKK